MENNKYCLFFKNSMSADGADGFPILVCFDCKGHEGHEMQVGEYESCDNYKEN